MGALTHLPLKHYKSPMQNHVPSNACDVISFYGQRQLCHLTVHGEEIFQTNPEWAHFSQEGPEKKPSELTLTLKLPRWKCTTRWEKRKKRVEEKVKRKVKRAVSVSNSKPWKVAKFCACPNFNVAPSSDDYKVYTKYTASKQLFGKTYISFLWPNSDQKTTQLASKQVWRQNSLEWMG